MPGQRSCRQVLGQTALHEAFGGVVPEIAARAHAERLDGVVEDALDRRASRWTGSTRLP
jgi:tRNA A37 threonylcarbamoyltransferase TsaD